MKQTTTLEWRSVIGPTSPDIHRAGWIGAFVLSFYAVAAVPIILFCSSCGHSKREPLTITFLDPEWSHDRTGRSVLLEQNLEEFEKQTGVIVKHLPAAETSSQQLALIRELRKAGSSADVYGVDVVWAGTLGDDLLDLKPDFSRELSADDPELVGTYTSDGRIVAVPYHTHVGILMYRADLLKKYGYRFPPQTWSELERMALHIQQGERAAGDKNFWGFVWPGASDEGLTCLALEWQVSEGGGAIIESNKTISVNNDRAIRAWQRAAHWIGWISPPSVTAYEEWDSLNQAEYSGEAAFRRGWTSDYFLTNPIKTPTYGRMGLTSVPGESPPGVGTVGGFGLGISRESKHQPEAIALVRFLLRKEAELEGVRASAQPPAETAVYRLPTVLKAFSRSMPSEHTPGGGIVNRPSAITGANYEKVSRAYADAVHSVLTGKKSAPEAAAALESELRQITGFDRAPPPSAKTATSRLK